MGSRPPFTPNRRSRRSTRRAARFHRSRIESVGIAPFVSKPAEREMNESHSAAIHVASLRKTYGRTVAVDGVSFDVQPGEIFGLIGPNGAGKTTTMECVEGLRRPDGG